MTGLLEKALEAARALPPARQDEVARVILMMAREADEEVSRLTPEERTAIDRSLSASARGDFASEDRMRSIWAKHGL